MLHIVDLTKHLKIWNKSNNNTNIEYLTSGYLCYLPNIH